MAEGLKDDKNLDLLLETCRDYGLTFRNRKYAREVLPGCTFRIK